MAIFTPRGLKIRLETSFAFALMSRLYPKVTAFRILKTTEGIDILPNAVAFAVTIICFFSNVEPINLFYYVIASHMIVHIILILGLFVIPGLISYGTLFSYISGFGIYLIIIIAVGLIYSSWKSVVAYFVARIFCWVIDWVIEYFEAKRMVKYLGYPLGLAERNFFNAYRLHANRIGASIDLEVTDDELKEEYYSKSLNQLAYEYPNVVARFTYN